MSGAGGYNAKVVRPNGYKVQTESGAYQVPFYFGGAQAPLQLHLDLNKISGLGLKMKNTDPTITRKKLVLPFHR
jgi:hypothetical protein